MKHIFHILICTILISFPAAGQRVGNLSLLVHFHQPTGSFAGILDERAGNAGFGPGLCLDIDLPVFPVFNWMTSLSIFANPYTGHEYNGERPVILMNRYYYKSADVLTGLRLRQDIGNGAELFCFGQLGVRRIAAPGFEGIAGDIAWRKEIVRYKFSPISRWGAVIGFGLLVEKKYALILRFSAFNNYDFEGLIELNDTGIWEEQVDHLRMDGSTLSLSIGLNLRYE